MTARSSNGRLAALTLIVYWGCILLGLGIPWIAMIAVDVVKHNQSFAQAIHQLQLHLFAPGYNLFLIAVLNAVPFMLFAIFSLFHLGLGPSQDQRLCGLRGAGVLVTVISLVGLSVWTHVMTLWYPDAQAAVAYIFLPILLIGLMPITYAIGRGVATLVLR